MPGFGKPGNPIHQHVAPRYIYDSAQEVGPPNIVTSVLASYRGFDTLGEVTVIFTAAVGVLLLLGAGAVARPVRPDIVRHQATMKNDPILLIVSNFLAAPIWIYAFYVQFHGDYGPGGGFQAGVILAAAIILYGLVYGLHRAQSTAQPRRVRTLIAVGLLLYGGVGLIALPLGGNYLDYSALAPEALQGQHLGILLVELGVGVTVAAVMITVYYSFAGRK
jgi:multicomponent Na+:H+ antiporter subunit B